MLFPCCRPRGILVRIYMVQVFMKTPVGFGGFLLTEQFCRNPFIFLTVMCVQGHPESSEDGKCSFGIKAEEKKKKNNQREQLKSLRLYQNQTFLRRKKSQPWIQREGSGFQQFTGGMKKNQNIWLKPVNNNNNNKLTLWGLAFSGIYHQIGKFGEVRSGPRGSRGGFCLSIWIWQLNQHSNGSSSSVLVLIKNFTLDS